MPDTEYLTAGLLGIVEGLTEFLPVSSTGHLILADALLGIEGPASKLFDIVIQLGAILAVCWVYRERFVRAAAGLTSDPIAQRFVANIVVAFLPAAVVGVTSRRRRRHLPSLPLGSKVYGRRIALPGDGGVSSTRRHGEGRRGPPSIAVDHAPIADSAQGRIAYKDCPPSAVHLAGSRSPNLQRTPAEITTASPPPILFLPTAGLARIAMRLLRHHLLVNLVNSCEVPEAQQ